MKRAYIKTLLLVTFAFFLVSCKPSEMGGLKGKIQKELDESPFLQETGIKLKVINEENGYVTIQMLEGDRKIREKIDKGTDIFSTQFEQEWLWMGGGKGEKEGVNALRKSLTYVKKIEGVKEVLLRAAINTPADQADDLYVKGIKLHKNKKYKEGIKYLTEAAELGNVKAQVQLGYYYVKGLGVKKDYKQAINYYSKTVGQDNLAGLNLELLAYAQNDLAWIYATCKDPKLRDGKKAVDLALKACSHEPNKWNYNGTLAAAYAKSGQFEKAIEAGEKAIALLKQDTKYSKTKKQTYLKRSYGALSLFKKHQPYVYED